MYCAGRALHEYLAPRSGERKGPIAKQWEGEGPVSSTHTDAPHPPVATRRVPRSPRFTQGCPGNWCNRLGLCKASPSPVAKQWERVPDLAPPKRSRFGFAKARGRVRALCLHSKCFSIPTCCTKEPSSGLRPPSPTLRARGKGKLRKGPLTSQARFLSLGRRDSAASAGISCRLIEFPRTALRFTGRGSMVASCVS